MRRTAHMCALVLLVLLALLPGHGQAQGFNQIGFATFSTDVTIVTTTEKDLINSGPVTAARQTVNVCVIAWAQVTTGTNTTALTPRIRRGTGIAGTAVGEANAEQVKAAAGSTEPMFILVCEDRSDVATVDYSLTVTQTAASANGSALAGGILVFVR